MGHQLCIDFGRNAKKWGTYMAELERAHESLMLNGFYGIAAQIREVAEEVGRRYRIRLGDFSEPRKGLMQLNPRQSVSVANMLFMRCPDLWLSANGMAMVRELRWERPELE